MSAGGNQKNRRGKLRFFRFVPQLSAEAVDASSGPHQNEATPHHNFELIPLVSTLLLHMTMLACIEGPFGGAGLSATTKSLHSFNNFSQSVRHCTSRIVGVALLQSWSVKLFVQ